MSEYIATEFDLASTEFISEYEEIVRCRDCKYFATDKLGDYCTLFDFEDVKNMEDKYCAWGERRGA